MHPLRDDRFDRRDDDDWVFGFFRWWDRVTGWSKWAAWFDSLIGTKSGLTMLLATTALLTVVLAMLVQTVYWAVSWTPAIKIVARPIVELVEERRTRSTLIYAIQGRDKWGRKGLFDVVVAKDKFLWVRGSSEKLERDGAILSGEQILSEVFDPEVRAGLQSAREIVAVGTASQEGNPATEVKRAGRRAKRTAQLVRQVVTGNIPVSTLNLGQYSEQCAHCDTDATNWQRPFVIIAVRELEPDAVLEEVLGDALTNQARLPPPENYTTFEFSKAQG